MFDSTFSKIVQFLIIDHDSTLDFDISISLVSNIEYIEMHDDKPFDLSFVMIHSNYHMCPIEFVFGNDIQLLLLFDDVSSSILIDVVSLLTVSYVANDEVYEFDRANHDNHVMLLELNKP